MSNGFFFSIIVIFSFLLTELIQRYLLKNNLIDTPNERSSHTTPTPRGGGLSIVITFLTAVTFIDFFTSDITIAIIGSGTVIAIIGFWDDHNHIAAKWRLLAHFAASFWILYWLGGIPKIQIFTYSIDAGIFGLILVAFLLVWLLNLFNFMDGIDGIAASEAIFISCGGAFFSWLNGLNGLLFISLALASSTIGFLILNWPPAKIFLGDVGSGFLGLMLGIIAYANIIEDGVVWVWLILFAVFLVDSGITLIRRIINGDKWYNAHCSHAYQHAARRWGHKRVTLSVIIINLFWLFPLAVISHFQPNFGLWIMLLAFTPLIMVAIKFKAGIKDGILQ